MTDRIQYIFLELTNCHRALTPEATVLENFCYVLHNIENLPDRPVSLENEIFRLLFDSTGIATFTPQEKIKYEYDILPSATYGISLPTRRKRVLKRGLRWG